MPRALVIAAAAAALTAALAPTSTAAAPAGGPLELRFRPGAAPQRTGSPHTLEVQVQDAGGTGVDGVTVDFEVTGGPGDDDIGTAGHTPETPDLSCVTAGGSANGAATCTVQYAEADNEGGSDSVLAWIDADGADATVEADLAEGENEHAAGTGGCVADSKGPGSGAEPDATDCAERRWIARVPAAIDVTPEAGSADAGATVALNAVVLDQFGAPLTGPGTASIVALELLPGSAHDPGDGAGFEAPDGGTCNTGDTGACSIPFEAATPGDDLLCGYVPSLEAACAEAPEAPERDNGADVVRHSWLLAEPPADPPAQEPPAEPQPEQLAPPVADEPAEREEPAPDRRRDDDRDRGREPDRRDDAPAPEPVAQPPDGESGEAAPPPPPAPPAGREPGAGTLSQRKARAPGQEPRASSAPAAAGRSPARRTRPARRGRVPDKRRSAGSARAADPRGQRRRDAREPDRLEKLSRAAARTADRYSFPLGLTLLVLGFIAVQGRIDRRDPKLRLAPVDSKHDLLPFT